MSWGVTQPNYILYKYIYICIHMYIYIYIYLDIIVLFNFGLISTFRISYDFGDIRNASVVMATLAQD